jgi:protein TonB
MSGTELQQLNETLDTPPAAYQGETAAWPSGELSRLIIAPALVTVLLVGGVYWIRLQPPAGLAGQQQTSIVQVHLLPRPDFAPIAVAPVAHPVTNDVASRTDLSLKEPDPTTIDDPIQVPKVKAFSPAEAPPNSAALKFRQALLRHVARYQRSLHLEGKVDTEFSMRRDGTLLGVRVKTSSGQALLDKEAVETIRRAQPLPPIPPELPAPLNIHIYLAFGGDGN